MMLLILYQIDINYILIFIGLFDALGNVECKYYILNDCEFHFI